MNTKAAYTTLEHAKEGCETVTHPSSRDENGSLETHRSEAQKHLESMDRPIAQRRWLRAVKWGGLLFLLALLAWGASTRFDRILDPHYKVSRASLRLDTVKTGTFQPVIYTTGVIKPQQTITLQNNVAGRVEAIDVEAGDHVQAGDVLFKLSNQDLEMSVYTHEVQVAEQINAINQRRQNLERARYEDRLEILRLENEINKRRVALERRQVLAGKGYDLPFEVEAMQNEKLYLEHVVELRREMLTSNQLWRSEQLEKDLKLGDQLSRNLESTRESLSALSIRAEIDGVMSDIAVERGEFVERGQTFATQFNMGIPLVETRIDEVYLNRVAQGDMALWRVKGQAYAMTVFRVHSEVVDGKFTAELEFAEVPPESLVLGQRLEFEIRSRTVQEETLLIANGGFINQTGGNWVFVLEEGSDLARKTPISVIGSTRDQIAMRSGVLVGQQVIVSPYVGFSKANVLELE